MMYLLISESELNTMLERRGSNYISCQGKFREEIAKRIRSRSPVFVQEP